MKYLLKEFWSPYHPVLSSIIISIPTSLVIHQVSETFRQPGSICEKNICQSLFAKRTLNISQYKLIMQYVVITIYNLMINSSLFHLHFTVVFNLFFCCKLFWPEKLHKYVQLDTFLSISTDIFSKGYRRYLALVSRAHFVRLYIHAFLFLWFAHKPSWTWYLGWCQHKCHVTFSRPLIG